MSGTTMGLLSILVTGLGLIILLVNDISVSEEEARQEGYEQGLCTFYIGTTRGLSPEEAYLLCDDPDFRETNLPTDFIDPRNA